MRQKEKIISQKKLSFLKRNRWRFLGLLAFVLIVSAYFYYWFFMPKENAPILKEQEDVIEAEYLYEEPEELLEEEISDDVLTHIHVQEHSLLMPDVTDLPEENSIIHVSALLKLEQLAEEQKSLPTNQESSFAQKEEQAREVRIAIVIDDMGASPLRTKEISALKAPLTSSFVTFASNLKQQMDEAEKAGHELMIHVPMQPKSNIFVSNDVLTIDMTDKQIDQAFKKMLSKFNHVVGVNNHMGSRFTERADKLAPIMKLLAEHRLFFLDSKTTPHSQGEMVAKKYNVPSVHRHVFLDNENNLEYILRQLELTEKIARKNGYAIAIGHPKTQTSRALSVWLKSLKNKKIELVHLSQLVYESEK